MNTRIKFEDRSLKGERKSVFKPIEFEMFRISNYGESATINCVEFETFGRPLL